MNAVSDVNRKELSNCSEGAGTELSQKTPVTGFYYKSLLCIPEGVLRKARYRCSCVCKSHCPRLWLGLRPIAHILPRYEWTSSTPCYMRSKSFAPLPGICALY